ncbi:hypothetical protein [Streptosporangium sp. NPDC000396]|uniref:hypothetical protein n=1 Tax=Streptosporangium sp. NPDC000396 TaxID=3366185 RepID=UPI0036C19E6D
MDSSFSPIRLPWDMLRLAAKFFLPLAFFYTLGLLAHDAAIFLSVWVAEPAGWRAYAGFGILSFALLATLMAYIAMLNTLGRQLSTVDAAVLTLDERERRLVEALAHTLLPFLIFYSAWELFLDDLKDFQRLSNELRPLWQTDFLAEAGLLEGLFDINVLIVVVTLVVFLLKVVVERLYESRQIKVLGLATSGLECLWMFFGIISIGNWIGVAKDWLTTRVVWKDAVDLIDLPGIVPEPLKNAWAMLSPYVPDLKDGLVAPMLWLAITAVVYSSDMTQDVKVIEGTRIEERVSGLWKMLPVQVQTTVEFFTRGFRDKYTPIINGLRFVLRAGPLFYLTFSLIYAVLEALSKVAFIGVTHLIGPHEVIWWQMWEKAAHLPIEVVHEVLRVCLLAAGFDLALRRVAAKTTAEVTGVAATSVPSPGASPA